MPQNTNTNPNILTLNQVVKKHNLDNACVQDLLRFLHEEKRRSLELYSSNPNINRSENTSLQQLLADTKAVDKQESVPRVSKEGYIDRYKVLSTLGVGGVGTVHLVLDEELNREVAMKVLHKELLSDEVACVRFRQEGQIAAQMQHPNIIPIYEMGVLSDKRLYFTMERIKGATLQDYIQSYHDPNSLHMTSFAMLMESFVATCRAIAFVHEHGVIHRDLKPSNIMVDSNGETLVVDWGLAKVLSVGEEIYTARDSFEDSLTEVGSVEGTPSFMAPEQAAGDTENVGTEADVYALGAILFTIISGSQPYGEGTPIQVLRKVLTEPIPRLNLAELTQKSGRYDITEDLINVVHKAMALDPNDRYSHAGELLEEIQFWTFAEDRQQRALKLLKVAQQQTKRRLEFQEKKQALLEQCAVLARNTHPWQKTHEKRGLWQCEDEASYLTARIRNCFLMEEQALQMALIEYSNFLPARLRLAEFYKDRHIFAEQKGLFSIASEAEFSLLEHVQKIPSNHPKYTEFQAYLNGTGSIALHSDQAQFSVEEEKYLVQDRHLICAHIQWEDDVSQLAKPLDMGSYLFTLHKTGFEPIRYPVHMTRCGSWSNENPEGKKEPLHFIPKGQMGDNDCYVPAGWFSFGGDEHALNPLQKKRIWQDGFLIKKYQVTNEEYLLFLNDLIDMGREKEALRYAPKDRGIGYSGVIYGRDTKGHFVLQPDLDGDLWEPDWPVVLIDWNSAMAYAQWYSQKTNRYWRLPFELEWEKAARGVDGRIFPWGDYFNPAWCSMRTSKAGRPYLSDVYEHPIDCSPYEVMGMAGNVREWTASVWNSEGPFIRNSRSSESMPTLFDGLRVTIKGGAWYDPEIYCRASSRLCAGVSRLDELLGFRLVSPLDERV